ncbi:hypothetical protein PanWU01x14_048080 [Parasponia andersonii]|uniref:Uncharacterized protein n=1 Tax=Parasponia andersonii TaxID=3476 RepID=A0A2P5DN74_PARAD|nr:hypothetical protein PanWU01x14_048080 [Parasponia andersonii]
MYLFLKFVSALAFYSLVIFYFLCNMEKMESKKTPRSKKNKRKKKPKEGSSLVSRPTTNLEEAQLILPKEEWPNKKRLNFYAKFEVIEDILTKLRKSPEQMEMFRKGCFRHLLDYKIKTF